MFDIIEIYHCVQFQGKVITPTWENSKKPSFRPNFGTVGPNFGCKSFFQESGFINVTRYLGQLSSRTISEKTNDPFLRKLSDGRTDGQTGGWEWFHRILSD